MTFEPAQGERAARILVAGDTPTDIDAAMRILAATATRDPAGSSQGLSALAQARGVRIRSGETVALSTLGHQGRDFAGRLFRTGFDVTLPTDFVPADYDRVALDLAGGYAAGLELGAQIVVDLNGRNVASLPLARADGDVFRDATVALPLSRWRPGRNRVEIRALLPTASDRVCEEGPARRRFLLLDRSTLTTPRLAQALRLPDLAATLGGACRRSRPSFARASSCRTRIASRCQPPRRSPSRWRSPPRNRSTSNSPTIAPSKGGPRPSWWRPPAPSNPRSCGRWD
ncbi:cellulose biosynthesis cyclic di-GMP-binding regulatory protein BcsB [Methylorubrum suomiense]